MHGVEKPETTPLTGMPRAWLGSLASSVWLSVAASVPRRREYQKQRRYFRVIET